MVVSVNISFTITFYCGYVNPPPVVGHAARPATGGGSGQYKQNPDDLSTAMHICSFIDINNTYQGN
jgi:hypothetical protein